MNNLQRSLLIDDYEDALFALLMDEVAQLEGERALALNEQLKCDPSAAVPESIQKRCKKTIRDSFAKKEFHKTVKVSKRIFRLISVAALVVIMLLTVAFAASQEFRRNTLNMIIEVFDEYGVLIFNSSSPNQMQNQSANSDIIINYNIGITGLPNSYILVDGWTDDHSSFVSYSKNSGENIDIMVTLVSENNIYQFDKENTEEELIEIQGFPATLSKKTTYTSNDTLRLLWVDNISYIVVEFISCNISESEILSLANNFVWFG